MTDEWFLQLSHKYEVERLELKEKNTFLQKKLSDMGKDQLERESFLKAVHKFMEMKVLTRSLLRNGSIISMYTSLKAKVKTVRSGL